MQESLFQVCENLDVFEQQSVYNFALFLASQHSENKIKKNKKNEKLSALLSFAGCMQETWKDIDPLEYQKKLREDREIG